MCNEGARGPAAGKGRPGEADLQFQRLFDKLPVGAYTCDADGLITYFNAAASEIWGRTPKINDPADRYCGSLRLYTTDGVPVPHDQCCMALALKTGEEISGREIVIERPDGGRHAVLTHVSPIFDDDGRVVGAVNVVADITGQKQSEQLHAEMRDTLTSQLSDLRRLHQMSMRLSTTLELQPILDETLRTAVAIEGADFGLLGLCDADGRGLTLGASQGLSEEFLRLVERVPLGAGACGISLERCRRVIVEDVTVDPVFTRYREAARQAGFRAVHSTPMLTRSRGIVGVLTTFFRSPHRPTERDERLVDLCVRQAVDFIENARLYQQLREEDRRKDAFLATLAHELRNPLAAISNSLHILRLSDDLTPTVEGIREVMEQQTDQLVRLVDDLLEITRLTQGKIELRREPVDLAAIIDQAVDSGRQLLESLGHQLAISIPREPVRVYADPLRLTQVVGNLLTNAARYTPSPGQIWLSVRSDEQMAVISVRDTGIGIPSDMLTRVFDMFTQVDQSLTRTHGGLGIGLTLVRALVELHGGQVEARSDGVGRGSEFVVRLPLSAPVVTSHSRGGSRPMERPTLPRRRILVVDDTPAAAYMLGKLLEKMGQDVVVVNDAASALEQLSASQFEIVISDVAMPRMDGHELARHIRRDPRQAGILLVALTGYGQASDREQAREAGFDRHLVKPVGIDSLIELLEHAPAERVRSQAGESHHNTPRPSGSWTAGDR